MNKRRLLKLADFLDKLPRKKFNFSVVVAGPDEPNKELNCGSAGCAIGWCPIVFPRLAKYGKPRYNVWSGEDERTVGLIGKHTRSFAEVGAKLFDIERNQACGLFIPGDQGDIGERRLRDRATPKQVAKLIRRFVAKNSKP